jgi:hypothetical protein
MTRTTIDLDPTVLQELKERSRREGRPMGALASELLAATLAHGAEPARPLRWITRPMGALVDLEDKEAVRRATGEP